MSIKKSLLFLIIFTCVGSYRYLQSMEKSEIAQKIALPQPTGPFKVGTTIYYWTDRNQLEEHAEGKKFRELVVQLWYPTNLTQGKRFLYVADIAPYVKKSLSERRQEPLSNFDYLDVLSTHAFIDAPLSVAQQKYPLLLFSHSFASSRHLYTTYLEELASHGYIVAAIDHPYAARVVVFPNGSSIELQPTLRANILSNSELCKKELGIWVTDLQFVLGQLQAIDTLDPKGIFTGHIDLEKIGIIGHSFGGSASLAFCARDKRCKAGISLDSPPLCNQTVYLKSPFLFLLASKGTMGINEAIDKYTEPKECIFKKVIEGADHNTFGDFHIVFPFFLKEQPNPSSLVPQEALAIIMPVILNFFDKYLLKPECKRSEGKS